MQVVVELDAHCAGVIEGDLEGCEISRVYARRKGSIGANAPWVLSTGRGGPGVACDRIVLDGLDIAHYQTFHANFVHAAHGAVGIIDRIVASVPRPQMTVSIPYPVFR